MERAQTEVRALRGSDCKRDHARLVERSWKDRPERVKAPYMKAEHAQQYPEYIKTRETLMEYAGTTP